MQLMYFKFENNPMIVVVTIHFFHCLVFEDFRVKCKKHGGTLSFQLNALVTQSIEHLHFQLAT